jgi:hypothetical protein
MADLTWKDNTDSNISPSERLGSTEYTLRGKIPESSMNSYNSQANIDGHQSGNYHSFNSTITINCSTGEYSLNYELARQAMFAYMFSRTLY